MRYLDAEPEDERIINGLTAQVDEGWCVLRWLWPRDAEMVYIEKLPADLDKQTQAVPVYDEVTEKARIPSSTESFKLYTREEYKAAGGYRERIDHFGKQMYRVHLAVEQDGETMLIRQHDGNNLVEVRAGKARIRYSIRQQGSWFSKRKTVRMDIHTEVPVERDVLCYVKKEGGYPANREDGIVYHFAEPFHAGHNELPAIEMGKNEYIRLFFTDGQVYGQLYELILE